jgi:hypothetical protein
MMCDVSSQLTCANATSINTQLPIIQTATNESPTTTTTASTVELQPYQEHHFAPIVGKSCFQIDLSQSTIVLPPSTSHPFSAVAVADSISNSNSNNNVKKRKAPKKNGSGCFNCKTLESPLWRRDGEGHTVCNKCGLYWMRHRSQRPTTSNVLVKRSDGSSSGGVKRKKKMDDDEDHKRVKRVKESTKTVTSSSTTTAHTTTTATTTTTVNDSEDDMFSHFSNNSNNYYNTASMFMESTTGNNDPLLSLLLGSGVDIDNSDNSSSNDCDDIQQNYSFLFTPEFTDHSSSSPWTIDFQL